MSRVRRQPKTRRASSDDVARAPSDAAAPGSAVGRLATVGGAMGALALLSYAVPALHRYRPWISGESIPIVRLYQHEAAAVTAEPATGEQPSPETPSIEETIVDRPPPPPPREPIVVAPSELEGLVVPIEDPSGHALDHFYAALAATARREDARVTRVAHFGDSTIALDGITMTVRERLQQRFGDAGHGFVLAARGFLPYRHHHVRHDSEGPWRVFDITHLGLSDGLYGLGGAQSRSVSGGTATFENADDDAPVGRTFSHFELFYQRHPRGGQFDVRVDGGEWVRVDTRGTETVDDAYTLDLPDAAHRVDVRTTGHGETRAYGAVLERSGPGVVYDSLGMVGARAARLRGFAPDHLHDQLARRATDLVVIAFGGNDADDQRSPEEWLEIFRGVTSFVRSAAPDTSCLLFAPLDQAERDQRGNVRTMEAVPRIVDAMRAAAEAEGCGFFDTYRAMGGEGAMGRWYRHNPRWATGDFRHATPTGYRVVGQLYYTALLDGFAHYVAREAEASAPSPSPGSPSAGAAAVDAPPPPPPSGAPAP